METKNGAVESFLGDLDQPQNDVFDQTQEDPFAETKTEEAKEEVVEVKEEQVLPYHKDPKVQKYIEKQIEKRLETFKPSLPEEKVVAESEDDTIVDAFTAIIGNDTPEKVSALKALKKTITSLEERTRKAEEAADFVEESKQAKEEERLYQEQIETGLGDIEETFKVDLSSNAPIARKTRNEFLDFIKRVAPKDKDGEIADLPDLMETFQVFKEIRKPAQTTNQAKDLAARGLSRSGESTTNSPKRVTWDNIDDLLGLNK